MFSFCYSLRSLHSSPIRLVYVGYVRASVILTLLFALALVTTSLGAATQPPRFEDYPAVDAFAGTPAAPKLTTPAARLYRTRIREGVEKGWGVYRDGKEQNAPGPNFSGDMFVVEWGAGAPGLMMAMVDARTGDVYYPPISHLGVGTANFGLPLLSVGWAVPRNPDVQFRVSSRLMIIRATPKQTLPSPSYTYYFLWKDHAWTLLRRLPLKEE